MAKQVSKTVIGGFVVSAIALLIAAVIVLGGGEMFKKKIKFVMFFEESIKGLSVGAPVIWKGVQIGSVSEIVVDYDSEKLAFNIPVIIELDPGAVRLKGRLPETPEARQQIIKRAIGRGLRAQITLQSFVTGQLAIDLDFHPDTPVRLTGLMPGYREIPTMTSSVGELGKKLKSLPIDEIADELIGVLASIKKIVGGPEIKEILGNVDAASKKLDQLMANANTLIVDANGELKGLTDNLNARVNMLSKGMQATLGDARKALGDTRETMTVASKNIQLVSGDAQKLLKNVDNQIRPVSIKIQDAMDSARRAMDGAKKTLATIDNFAGENSDTRHKLNRALDEIATAAQSLKSLTDYLERHPESLLKGKGGR